MKYDMEGLELEGGKHKDAILISVNEKNYRRYSHYDGGYLVKKELATVVCQRKVNKLHYVYIYTTAKMLHDGF